MSIDSFLGKVELRPLTLEITAGLKPDLPYKAIPTGLSRLPIKSMLAIRLPPVKETTFTSRGEKPYKKDWLLSNVF